MNQYRCSLPVYDSVARCPCSGIDQWSWSGEWRASSWLCCCDTVSSSWLIRSFWTLIIALWSSSSCSILLFCWTSVCSTSTASCCKIGTHHFSGTRYRATLAATLHWECVDDVRVLSLTPRQQLIGSTVNRANSRAGIVVILLRAYLKVYCL